MPAILSHWLLGEKLLPRIKEHPELERLDENCFLWGCQGPDVLFFSRLYPWMRLWGGNYRVYGTTLHDRRPSELFGQLKILLDSCEGQKRDRLLSYCMGMCCHYSLDRTTHPYINWLEIRLGERDVRGEKYHFHGHIEAMLDIILLRHEMDLTPIDMDLCSCIPEDDGAAETISLVYTSLLDKMFSVKMNRRTASMLADDMRACFRLINDPRGYKRPLIQRAERLLDGEGMISAYMRPVSEELDYDYANMCHEEWYNVMAPEQTSTDDFISLFGQSVDDAVYMTDSFMKVLRGEGTFAQYTEERTFSNNINESRF